MWQKLKSIIESELERLRHDTRFDLYVDEHLADAIQTLEWVTRVIENLENENGEAS